MPTAALSPQSVPATTQNGFSPFPKVFTIEAYEQLERITGLKYHYINGKVFEMPGGSLEHSIIKVSIASVLRYALRATDCLVLNSDMKVYVARKVFLYPDISVVCGEPLVAPGEALQNPVFVVEVLSPSTADFDKGEKFELYKQVESLRHVLFVEQSRPFIQHYEKDASGTWVLHGTFDHLTDVVSLTLGQQSVALPLAEVYERIQFVHPDDQPAM